jgi:hypothetical protein
LQALLVKFCLDDDVIFNTSIEFACKVVGKFTNTCFDYICDGRREEEANGGDGGKWENHSMNFKASDEYLMKMF